MTYDSWKTRSPDDERGFDAWMGEPPEAWHECPICAGEGAIEIWESVSKWSIDPPCGHVVPCLSCNGAGGFIDTAEPDA